MSTRREPSSRTIAACWSGRGRVTPRRTSICVGSSVTARSSVGVGRAAGMGRARRKRTNVARWLSRIICAKAVVGARCWCMAHCLPCGLIRTFREVDSPHRRRSVRSDAADRCAGCRAAWRQRRVRELDAGAVRAQPRGGADLLGAERADDCDRCGGSRGQSSVGKRRSESGCAWRRVGSMVG